MIDEGTKREGHAAAAAEQHVEKWMMKCTNKVLFSLHTVRIIRDTSKLNHYVAI